MEPIEHKKKPAKLVKKKTQNQTEKINSSLTFICFFNEMEVQKYLYNTLLLRET